MVNMRTESDASGVAFNDAALIALLASMPDKITQMLADVDESVARHCPSPEEWCIIGVVVHLSDVEFRYRARLERIVAEDNPRVPAIWPRSVPDPLPLLREALADFHNERVKTVTFLSALTPQAWDRPAYHTTLGTTTLRRQVRSLIAHDEDHLNQIVQTKAIGQSAL
jgi:hypothetical protein